MSEPTHRAGRTHVEERQHRKTQLAAALRLFSRYRFDDGVGGHITARDPLEPEQFWINPFGVHFGQVRVRDLLLVDSDGKVVAGEGRVNPAGFAIHSQIHAARPDAVAAAHTHSIYGRAFSTLHRKLDPITQDACAFFEDHDVHHDYGGVVLDLDEAKRIARTLGDRKAVILANHGLLTVGTSVQEAAWWFIAMDRSCHVQMLAEAAGRTLPIGRDGALAAREQIGTPAMGRLNFSPLYEAIVREQPDLLD
jgi:ribulose-5-phosphate 4-epimerase/fuculose-1-phosphate aldolase